MEEYKYDDIWEAYQTFATTAAVLRKGYEQSGMTKTTEDNVPNIADSFRRRGESDLEHQAKVAWLALVFLRMFWVQGNIDIYPFVVVALCHDVGEIKIGDIPDDGNPLHDTKDRAERKVFEEVVDQAFIQPSETRRKHELMELFDNFQNRKVLGAAIFALDKLEAILMQLLCEKHGNAGDLKEKENCTGRDKRLMEFTGSSRTSDIWAAHLCLHIKDFPSWIKIPVLGLLDTAVHDVRGVSFSWWRKIL